uniref:Uncharacterized protein n=1 Tax=Mycena chlorophos TaxID=658473 RepID=A0ABQ0LBI8_MYCCL|nr:predicted protein [Mycena chlorophos]
MFSWLASESRKQEPAAPPAETSHDRILSEIFAGPETPPDESTMEGPSTMNLYDPFDGQLLGTLSSSEADDSGKSNNAMWSHLSRVMELQNQISRLHLDLEEVGTGTESKGKKSRSRATSISRVVMEDVGEEGVDGTRDEEAELSRAREEQFAKLSGQFRGKKQAINDIMTKLDALSRAVTDFHALQAPNIDFANPRQDSIPATGTVTATDSLASPTFTDPRSYTVTESRKASLHRHEPETPQLVESPISTTENLLP